MRKIFLQTKDNKKIAANLFEAEKRQLPVGWLLLVHMMPAVKESWNDFAVKLAGLGYESLAIDLRGHGESDGGPEGYLSFSEAEHQAGILDVEAGVEFLIRRMADRGAAPEKIYLIGASIGANLSLQYIIEHPEIKKVILLSAGLNYRGVATELLIKVLKPDQRIFLVSARDDGRAEVNALQNQKLYEAAPPGVKKEIKIYETGGHGTDILKNQPDLVNLIIKFIEK